MCVCGSAFKCVYACVYHKRCDYHCFIVHLDHFVCAVVHMVASNTFLTMLYIFMCVSLSAFLCDVHLYCSFIIHISVTTEIPSEILCHAFTNWSFFPPNIMCVCIFLHIPVLYACEYYTENSWFCDLPYLQFYCLLMFVCIILTCACTPPNIHPFLIHNLQKG